MIEKYRKSPSRLTIVFSTVLMLLIFFTAQRWNRSKVIEADVVSYYSYLPALFVHGDISMEYAQHDPFYGDKVWGVIWKEGKGPVQKYTMGMAMMYTPFFLAAHTTAQFTDYPADGYSLPYRFWLQLSALFYLLIGMMFMRRVLCRYFSEKVTALVLLILVFGTNLFYYTSVQAPMPHAYLFALVSILLYVTIRFYEGPSWRHAIFLALTASLITLIRPNHILFWSIPLLYGVYNRSTLQERLAFFRKHYLKFLIWPLIAFLIATPQMLYWHYMTDHWIYYSYGEEGFFFGNPQFWRVLFSFRNGWLIYTPLMGIAVVGLFFLRRYAKEFAFAIPFFFLISFYVIASWWCWWYGGCFGNRVFIDLYPLLGLAIGAVLAHFSVRSGWLKRIGIGLIGALMLLNMYQSVQYARGLIHYDSMTARAWISVFGRWEKPADFEELLDHPDYDKALKGIY